MEFMPIFEGKLIRLASPESDDDPIIAGWTRDDIYMRNLDDDPVVPLSVDRLRDRPQHGDYGFHVRTLVDDTLIGFVALFNISGRNQTGEMAIGIGNPAYRGKGYGSDTLRVILRYAFDELNLHHLGLTVMAYNIAAVTAYERVGFVKEGVRREVVTRAGQRHDLVLYGILRNEWLATQST